MTQGKEPEKDIARDFDKFGIVSHSKETKIAAFVEALYRGKVLHTRCRRCGTAYSPPQAGCSHCLAEDMEWREIDGAGDLLSFTTIYYGPAGFEDETPYTVGLARFGEGVNVLAMFRKSIPESELSVGMKVRVVPVSIPPDKVFYELIKAE